MYEALKAFTKLIPTNDEWVLVLENGSPILQDFSKHSDKQDGDTFWQVYLPTKYFPSYRIYEFTCNLYTIGMEESLLSGAEFPTLLETINYIQFKNNN